MAVTSLPMAHDASQRHFDVVEQRESACGWTGLSRVWACG